MLDRIDIKFFKEIVGYSNIGKETDTDINAKCPVCGDGKKSNSKRLHLYNKGTVTNVNCFNGDCEVVNKTMYSFIRDFFPDKLSEYKKATFGNTINKLKTENQGSVFSNIKIEKQKEVKPVYTQDLSPYMLHLKESSEGLLYLRNRGIGYKPDIRGKWYYGTQDLKIGDTLYKVTDSIIIPLYYEKEMYGFYSRSTKDKNFVTYMDDRNIGYKIWNWFNINLDEPVYIFEGIFDAISSGKKNIIALLGAKLPDARLKEIKYPVFVLDNDRTGILNMIEYSKLGYSCFVQPDNIKEKDFNDIWLSGRYTPTMIRELIDDNTYKGLSARNRLKLKL